MFQKIIKPILIALAVLLGAVMVILSINPLLVINGQVTSSGTIRDVFSNVKGSGEGLFDSLEATVDVMLPSQMKLGGQEGLEWFLGFLLGMPLLLTNALTELLVVIMAICLVIAQIASAQKKLLFSRISAGVLIWVGFSQFILIKMGAIELSPLGEVFRWVSVALLVFMILSIQTESDFGLGARFLVINNQVSRVVVFLAMLLLISSVFDAMLAFYDHVSYTDLMFLVPAMLLMPSFLERMFYWNGIRLLDRIMGVFIITEFGYLVFAGLVADSFKGFLGSEWFFNVGGLALAMFILYNLGSSVHSSIIVANAMDDLDIELILTGEDLDFYSSERYIVPKFTPIFCGKILIKYIGMLLATGVVGFVVCIVVRLLGGSDGNVKTMNGWIIALTIIGAIGVIIFFEASLSIEIMHHKAGNITLLNIIPFIAGAFLASKQGFSMSWDTSSESFARNWIIFISAMAILACSVKVFFEVAFTRCPCCGLIDTFREISATSTTEQKREYRHVDERVDVETETRWTDYYERQTTFETVTVTPAHDEDLGLYEYTTTNRTTACAFCTKTRRETFTTRTRIGD